MKITEQTPTKLRLEGRNQQWLYGGLFGIPFVVIGLGIAVLTANLTTLECKRTQSSWLDCQRTITGLFGTETTSIPRVAGAGVIKAHGTGVVLSTAQGQVELVNHRMRVGKEQEQIARQITTFVRDPQQAELKVQQDDRWQGVLEGIPFFLPGTAVILAALTIPMRVSCCFDKTTEQMTLEKQYRLLYRSQLIQHRLAEIHKAQVVQLPWSTRNPVYFVQLITSTKPMSLSPLTRDYQECQTLVDAINRSLGD